MGATDTPLTSLMGRKDMMSLSLRASRTCRLSRAVSTHAVCTLSTHATYRSPAPLAKAGTSAGATSALSGAFGARCSMNSRRARSQLAP